MGIRVMTTFSWEKNITSEIYLKMPEGCWFWFLCINITICILLLYTSMFQ